MTHLLVLVLLWLPERGHGVVVLLFALRPGAVREVLDLLPCERIRQHEHALEAVFKAKAAEAERWRQVIPELPKDVGRVLVWAGLVVAV